LSFQAKTAQVNCESKKCPTIKSTGKMSVDVTSWYKSQNAKMPKRYFINYYKDFKILMTSLSNRDVNHVTKTFFFIFTDMCSFFQVSLIFAIHILGQGEEKKFPATNTLAYFCPTVSGE
jgi:hypothetical protein